jgi:hypothetical protein
MSSVSIHPVSHQGFIERLHEAFLDGDNASATKVAEAGNVLRLQEVYRALARGDRGHRHGGLTPRRSPLQTLSP